MFMFHWLRIRMTARAAHKALQNHKKRTVNMPSSTRRIGVLMDHNSSISQNTLKAQLDGFGFDTDNVSFLQFSKTNNKTQETDSAIFSAYDFSFTGKPDEKLQHFCNQKYDILINYFTTNNPSLQLLSLKTNTNFRIGFAQADMRLNDLIFSLTEQESNLFCQQMKEYMHRIQK